MEANNGANNGGANGGNRHERLKTILDGTAYVLSRRIKKPKPLSKKELEEIFGVEANGPPPPPAADVAGNSGDANGSG